jgi:hypothetical protein
MLILRPSVVVISRVYGSLLVKGSHKMSLSDLSMIREREKQTFKPDLEHY